MEHDRRRRGLQRTTNEPNRLYTCYACAYTASTKQAMAIHYAKQHRHTVRPKTRVRGSTCQACMKDHHTRTKLLKHLHKAKDRAAALLGTLLRHGLIGARRPLLALGRGFAVGPRLPFWSRHLITPVRGRSPACAGLLPNGARPQRSRDHAPRHGTGHPPGVRR